MTDEKDTSSATWKFEFEDTVNADPQAKGACLKVLRVYLNFCSKAKPEAFCSLPTLMLRAGSSKPRVLRAKATLEALGYLVPLYVTDEGAMMYRLVNARKEKIAEHLKISLEAEAAQRRLRKQMERRKKGGNKSLPPEDDFSEQNVTPVGNETIPNTVDETRRDSCSEVREGTYTREEEDYSSFSPDDSNAYAAVEDDPRVPFATPSSDGEADAIMAEILPYLGSVNRTIVSTLRRMLMDGTLSPAFISENYGGGHGA